MNKHILSAPQAVYSLAGVIFLSTLGVGVFVFAVPLIAVHGQGAGLLLGTAFSGYFLAKLLIAPMAGKLADKVGPKSLLIAGTLTGLLAPLPGFAFHRHEILYLVQFGMGISVGIIKPVATATIAHAVRQQARGKIFGLCNAFYTTAFFLAPLLGGMLFYHLTIIPVLLFLTVCMLASLLLVIVFTPTGATTSPNIPARNNTPLHNAPFQKATLLLAVGGRTACTACLISFYPALLAQKLHGPAWLLGIVFALPALFTCLCLPAGGFFADKINRTALTVSGMGISAVGLAALGRMETLPFFFSQAFFQALALVSRCLPLWLWPLPWTGNKAGLWAGSTLRPVPAL